MGNCRTKYDSNHVGTPEYYRKATFCSNSPDKSRFSVLKSSIVFFRWEKRLYLPDGLEREMINKVT